MSIPQKSGFQNAIFSLLRHTSKTIKYKVYFWSLEYNYQVLGIYLKDFESKFDLFENRGLKNSNITKLTQTIISI